jgi:hypothetical protein
MMLLTSERQDSHANLADTRFRNYFVREGAGSMAVYEWITSDAADAGNLRRLDKRHRSLRTIGFQTMTATKMTIPAR